MKRLLLGVALLAVTVLAACGGGNDSERLEQALQRMVLQPEDVSDGFVLGDQSFSDNEEASTGREERRALLEKWGRLLGYDVTYSPEVLGASAVRGINVSASLYRTEQGAIESFADAVKTADTTDWAENYPGLKDFRQETLDVDGSTDEIVWLRLSGFQPGIEGPDALITDDLIFFRIEQERGFLRVLGSSTETEDRQHLHDSVDGWLRTLVQNVKDALAAGDFGGEESE